ncbi:hypothetical protein THOM_0577 [Trachipleistophora hominis]|uniref:Variable surface protein n=1 Tax=Trachipleistophora hominis TaxID=72359 RepID=L7JZF3_TRAHO|nr:hypothetical protein THOM_0577 [Trachipleistophora hominis]
MSLIFAFTILAIIERMNQMRIINTVKCGERKSLVDHDTQDKDSLTNYGNDDRHNKHSDAVTGIRPRKGKNGVIQNVGYDVVAGAASSSEVESCADSAAFESTSENLTGKSLDNESADTFGPDTCGCSSAEDTQSKLHADNENEEKKDDEEPIGFVNSLAGLTDLGYKTFIFYIKSGLNKIFAYETWMPAKNKQECVELFNNVYANISACREVLLKKFRDAVQYVLITSLQIIFILIRSVFKLIYVTEKRNGGDDGSGDDYFPKACTCKAYIEHEKLANAYYFPFRDKRRSLKLSFDHTIYDRFERNFDSERVNFLKYYLSIRDVIDGKVKHCEYHSKRNNNGKTCFNGNGAKRSLSGRTRMILVKTSILAVVMLFLVTLTVTVCYFWAK